MFPYGGLVLVHSIIHFSFSTTQWICLVLCVSKQTKHSTHWINPSPAGVPGYELTVDRSAQGVFAHTRIHNMYDSTCIAWPWWRTHVVLYVRKYKRYLRYFCPFVCTLQKHCGIPWFASGWGKRPPKPHSYTHIPPPMEQCYVKWCTRFVQFLLIQVGESFGALHKHTHTHCIFNSWRHRLCSLDDL